MSFFTNKPVINRYQIIAVFFAVFGIYVLWSAISTMFINNEDWMQLSKRFEKKNVKKYPRRGNIFSADGQLLATSLPEYEIFMDYVVVDKDSVRCDTLQRNRNKMLQEKLDSICMGLNRILPDKSVKWYKKRISEGMREKSRHWKLYPKRVSFVNYKEICELPFFNKGKNFSGFHSKEIPYCNKPFGTLATRTIGDLYHGKDSARSGLQLAFDSVLRGEPGFVTRQKILNKYLEIVNKPVIDGADIKTTIDVNMQDFCEKALKDQLKEINGRIGMAILMEVKTGDIKAITSLTQCQDGRYREIQNNAVSNLMEPGSVFKPVAFMVAFNDGKIKMSDHVDVGNGVRKMYGTIMRDHNWRSGFGYGDISTPECLGYSSNIGVSVLIDKNYHKNPSEFVDGIYKTGIAVDLKLDIPEYLTPRIRRPKKDGSNWSNTALPWMSIGYETQIPPISVLNFYNGVANNGRMMRPRLVTQAMRGGEIIQEYPPQVIREQMCSSQALKDIQACLRFVVSSGLGKPANSKNFSISGKTGTAQIWSKDGFSMDYLVSFAGYFPSENPQYSCIVCIIKHGGPASGGIQCGPVFKKIAEMAMQKQKRPDIEEAVDVHHPHTPKKSYGNLAYVENVLQELELSYDSVNHASKNIESSWGTANPVGEKMVIDTKFINMKRVPDVRGMGMRDAVFLLEKMGLKVAVSGMGKVKSQSIAPEQPAKKGQTIKLVFEKDFISQSSKVVKEDKKENAD